MAATALFYTDRLPNSGNALKFTGRQCPQVASKKNYRYSALVYKPWGSKHWKKVAAYKLKFTVFKNFPRIL